MIYVWTDVSNLILSQKHGATPARLNHYRCWPLLIFDLPGPSSARWVPWLNLIFEGLRRFHVLKSVKEEGALLGSRQVLLKLIQLILHLECFLYWIDWQLSVLLQCLLEFPRKSHLYPLHPSQAIGQISRSSEVQTHAIILVPQKQTRLWVNARRLILYKRLYVRPS